MFLHECRITVTVTVARVDAVIAAFAIAGAAQAVRFGAHQCGDEGPEHRAQQVGACCGELVGQKLFGVDKVAIGHRVVLFQVTLVGLLKNHAVAVLIGVATRPLFQDDQSYTTLLD